MSYSKEQLKGLHGGSKVRTTYKVPTIKFNGNKGVFTKFPVGNFKDGEEITDIELVILRARRVFSSYEKAPGGKGTIQMFTNEHNGWEDHITIFESKTGEKIKSVGSGTIEDLRAEFPTLRINSNLYCLYEGAVHKLVIKGKSRQSLVDTQKELAKDGTELFEKKFKLVPTQEEGPGGNVYFYIKFEEVGQSDLDEIGPHMEKIAKVMDIIDEEYKERTKKIREEAEALTGGSDEDDDDDIPMDDDSSDDKMKVDEIPF